VPDNDEELPLTEKVVLDTDAVIIPFSVLPDVVPESEGISVLHGTVPGLESWIKLVLTTLLPDCWTTTVLGTTTITELVMCGYSRQVPVKFNEVPLLLLPPQETRKIDKARISMIASSFFIVITS
jgi:hypothetical protein|tara:strand:- start:113 stop:487 length:375 start_codon:yes stop_codon:yes gene_type:complete